MNSVKQDFFYYKCVLMCVGMCIVNVLQLDSVIREERMFPWLAVK